MNAYQLVEIAQLFTCAIVVDLLTTCCLAQEIAPAFIRSGHVITITLSGKPQDKVDAVILSAYGRQWGEAMKVKKGTVEFLGPSVRVPVVFRLIPVSNDKITLREVVVYPDPSHVRESDFSIKSNGTPQWFDAWCSAVGLSVSANLKPDQDNEGKPRKSRALLVVGRQDAGDSLAVVEQLALEHQIPVFVLDAAWFDPQYKLDNSTTITPKQLQGGLGRLQTQCWPSPPTFRQYARRLQPAFNRLPWILDGKDPMVEEVCSDSLPSECLPLVLSYLPWEDQLGRQEMIDELLFQILSAIAH